MDLRTTQSLVKSGGINAELRDSGGCQWTPLCCLSFLKGKEDAIKQLLDANAEVNHANSDGETPLWLASSSGEVSYWIL